VTLGKGVTFAECLPDSTRQRIHLCRVSPGTLGKESAREGPYVRSFAEYLVWHSAKRASLPSARAITLDKEPIPVPRSWFFSECYGSDTRQSTSLPSVTLGKVTSRHLFYLFSLFHPNKQKYSIDITNIHHRSSQTYIANTNSINTNSDISIQHKLRGLPAGTGPWSTTWFGFAAWSPSPQGRSRGS
jgi:hypothetical protein